MVKIKKYSAILCSPALAVFFGFLALLPICSASGQDSANSGPKAAVERANADLEAEPSNPTHHFIRAIRQHNSDDLEGALASLSLVLKYGDGFLPSTEEFFPKLRNNPDYRALVTQFELKLPRIVNANIVYRFSDRTLLPEGVAWDSVTNSTFIGSARGLITKLSHDGAETVFARISHDPLTGLIVHDRYRWICGISTNANLDESRLAKRNVLACFDIDTAKEVRIYNFPEAGILNDVQLDHVGKFAYLTDTGLGAVWRLSLKTGNVDKIVPANALRDPNGIALSGNGQLLYVSHRTGIALYDLTTKKLLDRIPSLVRDNVSVIDGLYFTSGDLVGVQSITNPGRVIRINLSDDGRTIDAVETLQSHHNREFDQPTTGVVLGSVIRVLATTQVSRLQADRSIKDADSLKNPTLIDVPLCRSSQVLNDCPL